MISIKKWPWVLLGTILSMALWTFISINTDVFESEDTFQYFTYLTSYILVIGFWGLVVLKLDISEKLHKTIGIAMFSLTPFFCMQIAMILSGAAEYSFGIYFINIMFYISLMGIFFAATRSFNCSAIITVAVSYVFNLASFIVNVLRGTPLIPSDFLAIGTAAQVAENYTFEMRYPMIAATVIAALVIALIAKFWIKPKFRFKNIIMPISGVAVALVFMLSLSAVDFSDSGMDVFDQYHANNTHGTMYSFYINVRKMILRKPDGYDENNTSKLLSSYENQKADNADYPNIIVIMNESFSDLSVVGDFKTNEDYMPFINSLKKNTVKGEMLVSPFGGYTCNTEFEFLTGLTMGLLPNGSTPYLQYASKSYAYSLPSHLRDNGYKTVALHPYFGRCWNRQKVYNLMGFDNFISIDNLDKLIPEDEWEYIRYYLSDKTSFNGIEKCLENKNNGEKLFMFNVTMQNHGGYTYNGPEFPTITIEDMQGHYKEAEQYLSLVRESDEAFKELINYLKNFDEHTIVVMFGDHQPAIEQEFYEELYGKPLSKLSLEELQQRYKVPFVIWANYDIESQNDVLTSTNYLSNIVLDVAGVPKSNLSNFTDEVRKEIPRINGMGYYDANGVWHENDTDKPDILKRYNDVEYFSLTSKDK